MHLHWNRRSGFDRRYFDNPAAHDTMSERERRRYERRRPGSDDYLLVMGGGGVDRFGMAVLIPAVLLVIAAVVLVSIAP